MTAADVSRLVLVRHGRTEANASGLLVGRADVALDDLGEAQAALVAATLRSGRFGEIGSVVSSPLRRAMDTAAALGLPIDVDERLVELDYGELDGTPLVEVPTRTWQEWRRDPSFCPPSGESLVELQARVASLCDQWRRDAPTGTVVAVSHVSPIKAAMVWSLGGTPEMAWRSHLDNASITCIERIGDRVSLRIFNETAHL